MTLNLYDRFHQTARRQPDCPAILGPQVDAVVSYRALDEAMQTVSDRLRAVGVGPGDCVGLHYASSMEYIICTYAIWRCGGCVVPLPTELTGHETAEVCRCIALDYAITSQHTAGNLAPFHAAQPSELFPNALVAPLRAQRQHPSGFEAIHSAFIRFTSGTTGVSKGVVLSHESIAERIRAANDVLSLGPHDRVLWVLSMSYHFTVSIVAYLSLGAAIVFPQNHFAAAVVQALARRRSTLLYASPVHFALLADYPQGGPLPQLRLAISSTSALDNSVAARFCDRYGLAISQALGIIEIGLPCINVQPTPERATSVGKVSPAYRLRMEDLGLGPDLREILLSGPGFLDAYYHPFGTRAEIMPDGWFRTGDVGFLDEEGYLFLKGRSKEVINVMGMKFFSAGR
jgi:long-chain acyl-CoA synthetase